MSHGHGRRKPAHNYAGSSRGEAPSSSSSYHPSAGQREEYYPREYSYRTDDQSYNDLAPSYQGSEYTPAAPWSYGEGRLDNDPHSWRREEAQRRSPVYRDYPDYREDASTYPEPRNDEWQDHRRQAFSHPYTPYRPHEEPQYSSRSNNMQREYNRNYRDYYTSHDNGGYANYRHTPDVAYYDSRRDYEGYGDYRRPPLPSREMEYQQASSYSNYNRRSASPPRPSQSRGFASNARAPVKPVLFQSPPILRPSSPSKPVKPAEPTESYLAISLQPSSHIPNPTDARKLIVLDLNGSLVLRSAHSRRIPPPRQDPYADPTQLRPLRTVHRRPYLTSFTSYLLHDETKKWLDTMVWSSAQPHSVADMVEHCFGERKSELKAVWARDTLGLSADDYHKKTLTLKDLEKPWVKLAPHETSEGTRSSQSHSALGTLLVDDSPAKAALQPWNHLCIRDYVQAMRNIDILVAERQTRTQPRTHSTLKQAAPGTSAQPASPHAQENDHQVHRIIREVVMVDGELTGLGEEVLHGVTREVVMIDGQMVNPDESPSNEPADPDGFVPNQKRKLKRLAKKENARMIREEKEREAFEALRRLQSPASGAVNLNPNTNSKPEEQVVEAPVPHVDAETKTEMEMRFDETLLAVIGILDHVKHEGNIAGWMRSGGLLQIAGQPESHPEAPPTQPQPGAEEQASTGVPLSSPIPKSTTAGSAGLWYEDPAVLRSWADRGRHALKELGIPEDSGMV